jgi:hypothetical protein
VPDLAAFPRAAWLRATHTVLARLSDVDLGDGDPRGWLPLRAELAGYLARVRGGPAEPDRILIANGGSEAFGLLSRVLAGRGQPWGRAGGSGASGLAWPPAGTTGTCGSPAGGGTGSAATRWPRLLAAATRAATRWSARHTVHTGG